MNPAVSILLRYVVGPLVIAISAFFYGQHVGKAECQAAQAKQQIKTTAVADQHLAVAQTQDAVGAQKEDNRETIVREIDKTVPQIITQDHVVYSNNCIDAAGLRSLSSAVTAANGR